MSMILNPFMVSPALPAEITYVGGLAFTKDGDSAYSSNHTIGGNLTGGSGSDTQAGDLIVLVYGISSTNDQSAKAVSGYTSQYTVYVNTTNDANVMVYTKIAAGAGEAVTLPASGGANGAFGVGVTIAVFRGENQGTPLDVAVVAATGTTGVADPPSITPVTSKAVVVSIGVKATGIGTAVAMTSPDLLNFINAVHNTGSLKSISVGMGYTAPWVSGAVNPAAFGGGADATSGVISVSLAIRPA